MVLNFFDEFIAAEGRSKTKDFRIELCLVLKWCARDSSLKNSPIDNLILPQFKGQLVSSNTSVDNILPMFIENTCLLGHTVMIKIKLLVLIVKRIKKDIWIDRKGKKNI